MLWSGDHAVRTTALNFSDVPDATRATLGRRIIPGPAPASVSLGGRGVETRNTCFDRYPGDSHHLCGFLHTSRASRPRPHQLHGLPWRGGRSIFRRGPWKQRLHFLWESLGAGAGEGWSGFRVFSPSCVGEGRSPGVLPRRAARAAEDSLKVTGDRPAQRVTA